MFWFHQSHNSVKEIRNVCYNSTELKWFPRYVRGRKQVVKFHQETSEACDITWGVPQGSGIGPMSFLLFINEIFNSRGLCTKMYADDFIIYTSATPKDKLQYRFQGCTDSISNWYSVNKLRIDKKKSNFMVIESKCQLKQLLLEVILQSL